MGRSALYWEVLERVLNDDALGDAGSFVAAALDGPEALAEALDRPARPPNEPPPASRGRAPEVWLRSVSVTGFRGIGPEVQLHLDPTPGLVLIVGRNGSGKSSLAEGVEVLVTGSARRLHGLSKEWQEGWRNLHCASDPCIEAALSVEGIGDVTLTRSWTTSAIQLTEGELSVHVARERSSLEDLGWDEALELFRPFLGTGELARSLDKGPSVVYDALQGILGLHELTDATRHLAAVRKELKGKVDAVKNRAKSLASSLDQVDDPRAAEARAGLLARSWDLDALEQLAHGGGDSEDAETKLLRTLSELSLPDQHVFLEAAESLRHALDAADSARGTVADQEHRAADVLRAALSWHETAGDGPCPVCRTTALDESWREDAERWRAAHEAAAEAAIAAARAVRQRETALRALLRPVPAALQSSDVFDTELAENAWKELLRGVSLTEGALADHVEAAGPDLCLAVEDVRERARQALTARQDLWRPRALELGGWVADARALDEVPRRTKLLSEAEKWLKGVEAELRDLRFAPLAREACAIWSLLRQGSHVDLAKVSLAGRGTRRRVELNVTVDGEDSVALGVMSQGEVNALALSLFLPRMTLAESPFRFLVLDDPVQAMDPHKVDGLARVLAGVAETRQVVVLTHDPRLFEAVRRLRIEARVVEVQRRGSSVVELREALDPVEQHLRDARHVALNADKLGDKVPGRVVPGMCRAALEAAFTRVIRRRRLGRGEAFAVVDELLRETKALMSLAALGFYDDGKRGGDVLARLNGEGRWAGDLFQALRNASHHGYTGDLVELVGSTKNLVRIVERLS